MMEEENREAPTSLRTRNYKNVRNIDNHRRGMAVGNNAAIVTDIHNSTAKHHL